MVKGYLLGLDIGSSSVKASLTDIDSGMCSAAAFYPKTEAAIKSVKMGWAEQDPQDWWDNAILSIKDSMHQIAAKPEDIKAIEGFTRCYNMVRFPRRSLRRQSF